MRVLSSIVVILVFTSLSAAITGACGPLTQQAATPDSPVASLSAPEATATALFQATNRKLAEIGHATLAPGMNPDRPYASITYAPNATSTPGPSPTSGPPSCGATIVGWSDLVAQFGPMYEKFGCGPIKTSVGAQLVIMTVGKDGGPGAIATYLCEPTDARCLSGLSPAASDATWSVYPANFNGGVAYLGNGPTADDLLLGFGHCFNLATHLYDDNCK